MNTMYQRLVPVLTGWPALFLLIYLIVHLTCRVRLKRKEAAS